MAVVGMGARIGRSRHNRWLGPTLVGAAALLFTWQFAGTSQRGAPARAVDVQAMSQHCEQFVEVAKASFGPNWKPRLDPTDPLCASEIQHAWERQRIPRNVAIVEPTPTPVQPVALPKVPDPPPPKQSATRHAEVAGLDVFCLNTLGLTRTKFGSDWKNYVTSQAAAKCQSYLAKMN